MTDALTLAVLAIHRARLDAPMTTGVLVEWFSGRGVGWIATVWTDAGTIMSEAPKQVAEA